MMLPPNYWATPGNIFPLATMGAGAFGMGVISNSTSAIGPVVSSAMVPTVGWSGVFWIMAILSFIGIGINYWAGHSQCPLTMIWNDEECVLLPANLVKSSFARNRSLLR